MSKTGMRLFKLLRIVFWVVLGTTVFSVFEGTTELMMGRDRQSALYLITGGISTGTVGVIMAFTGYKLAARIASLKQKTEWWEYVSSQTRLSLEAFVRTWTLIFALLSAAAIAAIWYDQAKGTFGYEDIPSPVIPVLSFVIMAATYWHLRKRKKLRKLETVDV